VTGVLIFVPFVAGVGLAFFHHDAGTWTFVGAANFVDIVSARGFDVLAPLSFWYALLVTVAWTAANVALHLGLGFGLALVLNRPLLALRPVYRVLLILPWAVPSYITALMWKGLFHAQFGAINGLLEAVGLGGVAWFDHAGTAFFANVCANAWLGFPFMMVVSLGALQAVPKDLLEAADVDGATPWQRFRHVTLPLVKPALVPAVLLGVVWTFNQFNIIYLVSGGAPDNATDILISEAYRWAFARREQYGYAAAYALLIFGLLLLWSRQSMRISRRLEGGGATPTGLAEPAATAGSPS
jgi:arabinogalactan oligomer/maltooligosaccharide transport system permease protein